MVDGPAKESASVILGEKNLNGTNSVVPSIKKDGSVCVCEKTKWMSLLFDQDLEYVHPQ